MKNRTEMLRKFARLTARVGVNVQKGQTAVITAPVECMEVARLIAEECWLAGAGDVFVHYSDTYCARIRYQHGALERLTKIPQWVVDRYIDFPKGGACFIYVDGDDPDVFAGLDSEKVGKVTNAMKHAKAPYYDMIDRNENQWNIVAVPTVEWAKKVFSTLETVAAVEKLWQAIFMTMRLDQPDPVAAWEEHSRSLAARCKFMNDSGIRTLEMRSGLGTALTVELAEDNLWCGGASATVTGAEFQANMPTEEVFSMPHRARVNGRVVSSMPLCYQGSMIDRFSFTFTDGVVTDYSAEVGLDVLKQMLAVDDGAKQLGEVALVPYSSPIRRSGILFYSTLFDENASCHLALGSAYTDNMAGCLALTEAERTAKGFNKSVSHVDFMFGTPDLSVTGKTADGRVIPVFVGGEWAADC